MIRDLLKYVIGRYLIDFVILPDRSISALRGNEDRKHAIYPNSAMRTRSAS